MQKIPMLNDCPVAIIDKKWLGLRVKVDFVLNRKPFWVWRWQIKYVQLGA